MNDLKFVSSSLLSFCSLFVILSLSSPSGASHFPIAKSGSSGTCGDVKIPYHFGIGRDCALYESYTLVCNQISAVATAPFTKISPNPDYLQVLNVSLRDQTVTLNIRRESPCLDSGLTKFSYVNGINLTGSPFYFSKKFNKLMLLGRGNALLNQKDVCHVQSGCTSMCDSDISFTMSDCYGINCCQTSIPFDLSSYWVNFTVNSPEKLSSTYVSGFLVKQTWKPSNSSPSVIRDNTSYVPVVMSWALANTSDLYSIPGCVVQSSILELESGNVTNYHCECERCG